MSADAGPRPWSLREACARDDAALRALAAACPMQGDLTLCVTREPSFFTLSRLEGERAWIAVAEADGALVGCVMLSERRVWWQGAPQRILYAGDLKVHPGWRGRGVGEALVDWVVRRGAVVAGPDAPMLLTVLAGNQAMHRRLFAATRTTELPPLARLRSCSIPLLWPRRVPDAGGLRVRTAVMSDLDEMLALWSRVAPSRQCAAVLGEAAFRDWLDHAPGLSLSDYQVAVAPDGRLKGFLAWWDQSSFKQLQVQRYSPRLRVARHAINAVATLTGAARLPRAHEALRHRTAVHVCVPAEDPAVLRALLLTAFDAPRRDGCAFVNVGLDVRDPLCAALHGLFAQPTDIDAFLVTPRGAWPGALPTERPLHYEIALV